MEDRLVTYLDQVTVFLNHQRHPQGVPLVYYPNSAMKNGMSVFFGPPEVA